MWIPAETETIHPLCQTNTYKHENILPWQSVELIFVNWSGADICIYEYKGKKTRVKIYYSMFLPSARTRSRVSIFISMNAKANCNGTKVLILNFSIGIKWLLTRLSYSDPYHMKNRCHVTWKIYHCPTHKHLITRANRTDEPGAESNSAAVNTRYHTSS